MCDEDMANRIADMVTKFNETYADIKDADIRCKLMKRLIDAWGYFYLFDHSTYDDIPF